MLDLMWCVHTMLGGVLSQCRLTTLQDRIGSHYGRANEASKHRKGETMSGVQVLQDGNPRKGGMDEDECDQCIHDIINWFERKADLEARGANNKEIDALEEELGRELPPTLRDLLKKQSGGLWFESFKSLSPEEIVRTTETLAGYGGWKPSFVPFAADVDNNSLVVDVAAKNAVYYFCDDGLGEQKGASLSAYLEKYRNQLLSGQYDFVEDVGVVERSSSRK